MGDNKIRTRLEREGPHNKINALVRKNTSKPVLSHLQDLSTNQEEVSPEITLVLLNQISILQNCEKTKFCYFSYLV